MIPRPVDAVGDILPVLCSRDILSGPEAEGRVFHYSNRLLTEEDPMDERRIPKWLFCPVY